MDDHWPSLPPIRTSSYKVRVSCETLNSLPSSPPASRHQQTPFSSSNTAKDASKSVETTPPSTSCSTPHSHCFPHMFSIPKRATCPGHESKRPTGGGTFDPTGLFRSFCGFPAVAGGAIPRYSSPIVSSTRYSSGLSPSHRPASSSTTNSPSGRMRSGGTTPIRRSSKGHAAHVFTMMPPDVVGKKKPPGYEADEPTSPEVTCAGRVRRKQQCKAGKDKHKDGKKKGKVKKPTVDIPHKAGLVQVVKRSDEAEAKPTMSAKLSKQRSERRKSFEIEGFVDVRIPRPELFDSSSHESGQFAEGSVIPEPAVTDKNMGPGEPSLHINDSHDATTTPPSQGCLLLMKKGSKHHDAYYLNHAPEMESS